MYNRHIKNILHIVSPIFSTNSSRLLSGTHFHSHSYRVLPSRGNILKSRRVLFSTMRMSPTFKLGDYDCIGFDLDNTLLHYNISNMIPMVYDVVTKFLVEKKGYNSKYLYQPLDFDFLQKGLFCDFEKGNVFKMRSDGTILKVSHGTKLLSEKELLQIYPNGRWEPADLYSKDMLSTWEEPHCLQIRALLDYFDIPVPLIFARLVDTVDEENGETLCKYNVWPSILEALQLIFFEDNFQTGEGGYFDALKKNPDKYLCRRSEDTVSWLRELNKQKTTFLITGSRIDFADFTASYAFGPDWKSLFDVIICSASKPHFFTMNRPFYQYDGFTRGKMVENNEKLETGTIYNKGNWKQLYEYFSTKSGKSNPKCLYFGDNLVQDIYVPNKISDCDIIAVVEEMYEHQEDLEIRKIMYSKFWGSYFTIENEEKNIDESIWTHVIRKYSKLCIPDTEVLVNKNLDDSFECFDKDQKNNSGFYPKECAPVLPQSPIDLEL